MCCQCRGRGGGGEGEGEGRGTSLSHEVRECVNKEGGGMQHGMVNDVRRDGTFVRGVIWRALSCDGRTIICLFIVRKKRTQK